MFDFYEDYYAGQKNLNDTKKYIGVINFHGNDAKGPGIIYNNEFTFSGYKFIESYKNKKPHGMYIRYDEKKNLREVGFQNEGEYTGPCLSATNKEGYLTSFDQNSNEHGFYVKFINDGYKFIIFSFNHGKLNSRCLICDGYRIYKGSCNSLDSYKIIDESYLSSSFLLGIPLVWLDAYHKGIDLHRPGKIKYFNWYNAYQGDNVVKKTDQKYCYIYNDIRNQQDWAILKTSKHQIFGEYSWGSNDFYGLYCERNKNGKYLLGSMNGSMGIGIFNEGNGFSLATFENSNINGVSITIYDDSLFIDNFSNGNKTYNIIRISKDTFNVDILNFDGKLIKHMPYDKNDRKEEQGCTSNYKKETYPDGAWYEGEMKNGQRHGQGTFYWNNGTKYVGRFANGVCHGEGIVYYNDGTSNKVVYNNNEIVSRLPNIIRENYSDGAWYEGEMKNGHRHGQGTFYWTNGTKYVGRFSNGICDGEGIIYYNDGTSEKVIYQNNNIVSRMPNIIRENYSDGAWYEGEMKNGHRHGQGTFCWNTGTRYVGGFNNGALHGEGIIYHNNGVKEKVVCDNGNYIHREII